MNITLGIKSPFAVSELQGLTATGGAAAASPTYSRALLIRWKRPRQTAQSAAMNFLANGQGDVHTVALAAQRAELSLEMFQQVRNKFVSAYQEVMKMPM